MRSLKESQLINLRNKRISSHLSMVKKTYLIRVGQRHGRCGSCQLCIQGRRSNEPACSSRPWGRPLLYHGDACCASSAKTPANHVAALKTFCETVKTRCMCSIPINFTWYAIILYLYGECIPHTRSIFALVNKEVFVKHEQAPTAPKLEGVWVFVDLKYIFYENRYFWPIWQLPVGCFWPEWSKHTSTDQDLSFEPITKSLLPSVQKF